MRLINRFSNLVLIIVGDIENGNGIADGTLPLMLCVLPPLSVYPDVSRARSATRLHKSLALIR